MAVDVGNRCRDQKDFVCRRAIPVGHGSEMELRHLRYFVAIAEERSLTLAAKRRLHTAQPSLSRQMRDLESEIGVELFVRGARGIKLTTAGTTFLQHARLILAQTDAAAAAARHAAQSDHRTLVLGFLSGCEPRWLPAVTHVLRDERAQIAVKIASRHSPQLAEDVATGMLDAAFMRPEEGYPNLVYKTLMSEPLIVVMRSDHRLAGKDAIDPPDLAGEAFVGMDSQAPVLCKVIEDYFERSDIDLVPSHTVEYLSMAISLVASTHGICLLPEFARGFLTSSVIGRPLAGKPPSIDLVLGYHKDNKSKALELLLGRVHDLIRRSQGATA